MEKQNKKLLYEHIHEIINQFTYSYEEGLTIDINEILFRLHTENKIKHFTLLLDSDNHHYRVIITLEECSAANTHSLFWSLIRFISYSGATISAKKQTEKGVHYEYASFSEDGKGFCCEVDFLAEEAETKGVGNQRDHEDISLAVDAPYPTSPRQPYIQWKYKVDFADSLPPIAVQDMIYSVSADGGHIYAADAKKGILQWHWKAILNEHAWITSSPKAEHGILYVPVRYTQNRQRSDSFYAIDLQTGQTLKHFPISSLQPTEAVDFLTVHDDVIYLSGTNCNTPLPSPNQQHAICQAINLQTGTYRWVTDLGEHQGISTPIVANTHIYLVTRDHQHFGHLYALNAQTGEEIWHYTLKNLGTHGIVVVHTDIFVVNDTLEVIDALTGEKRWSLPDMDVVLKGTPVVSDKLVCLSYEHTLSDTSKLEMRKPHEILLAGGPALVGGMLAVDRAGGELRWMVDELARGHAFTSTEGAITTDGVLYTVWNHLDLHGSLTHATLYALNLSTGQERWRFEANSLSAPSAANGMVFVQGRQGEDHSVFALS